VAVALVILLTGILIAFANQPAKRELPPTFHRFMDKYEDIRDGRTEEDSALRGYPSSKLRAEQGTESIYGQPLKTESAFVKTYDSKPAANEGDYVIRVYFDQEYRVVGKCLGGWVR
jgi:hypothetical protein